jgi:hypothetical protein
MMFHALEVIYTHHGHKHTRYLVYSTVLRFFQELEGATWYCAFVTAGIIKPFYHQAMLSLSSRAAWAQVVTSAQ